MLGFCSVRGNSATVTDDVPEDQTTDFWEELMGYFPFTTISVFDTTSKEKTLVMYP
jgi:hypothetical protein